MKLQESDGSYHTTVNVRNKLGLSTMLFSTFREAFCDIFLPAPTHLAVLRPGHVGLEVHLQPGELELRPLQRLPQRLVVVRDGGLGALAEGQGEVRVGLLAVVVRANRVHP